MKVGDTVIDAGRLRVVEDIGVRTLDSGAEIQVIWTRVAEKSEVTQDDLAAIEAGRRVTDAIRAMGRAA